MTITEFALFICCFCLMIFFAFIGTILFLYRTVRVFQHRQGYAPLRHNRRPWYFQWVFCWRILTCIASIVLEILYLGATKVDGITWGNLLNAFLMIPLPVLLITILIGFYQLALYDPVLRPVAFRLAEHEYETILPQLRKGLARYGPTAQRLQTFMEALLATGHYDEALQVIEQLDREYGGFSESRHLRAWALVMLGRDAEALPLFETPVDSPQDSSKQAPRAQVMAAHAIALARAGRHIEGRRLFKELEKTYVTFSRRFADLSGLTRLMDAAWTACYGSHIPGTFEVQVSQPVIPTLPAPPASPRGPRP